jgi:glycosyltransferase involved in cell wall biosynthesis
MHIVHAIPALTKGGAEKVLVDLANEARGRGHDVSVITGYSSNPSLISDRLSPQIALHSVSAREGDKRGAYGGLPLWLWRQREWLDTVDVVHCHLTYAALFGSLLKFQRILRGKHSPAIVETFHCVGMPIRTRQRWLAATLARGRDGFALMAEDPFWLNFLARHPAIPSAVIPNGLATDGTVSRKAAQDWRAALGIPAGAPVIGTIGRIRAERNPLATIAAFARAAAALPDAHFIMGGDGPMTDAVRATAQRLGMGERLHLPGLVLDPMLALANIDLYVSMNVGAITGIAGLEAAAAGVPQIALQAREDYRDGGDDWIWSSLDPAKVGAELVRLLQAPVELTEMAARQRRHVVANFSVAAMQDAYESLYARAISEAGI